jgi:hypothetical protein
MSYYRIYFSVDFSDAKVTPTPVQVIDPAPFDSGMS